MIRPDLQGRKLGKVNPLLQDCCLQCGEGVDVSVSRGKLNTLVVILVQYIMKLCPKLCSGVLYAALSIN